MKIGFYGGDGKIQRVARESNLDPCTQYRDSKLNIHMTRYAGCKTSYMEQASLPLANFALETTGSALKRANVLCKSRLFAT